MTFLILETSGGANELPLAAPVTKIGRSASNHIQIDHPSVSEFHCEIHIEDDLLHVRDLDSAAGTFIDGRQVSDEYLLPGQVLRVGEADLRLPDLPVPEDLAGSVSMPEGVPGRRAGCANHPNFKAEFQCRKCGRTFCEHCVKRQYIANQWNHFCPSCGDACLPIQAQAPSGKSLQKQSFPRLMLGAFAYPFQRDGAILLTGGALFFGLFSLMGVLGLLLAFIPIGYMFAYMQRIICSSAQGDEEMPNWPEMSRDELIEPCLQLAGTLGACLAPGLIVLLWLDPPANAAGLPLLLLGLFYLPMALLAVAMFDTVAAVNPLLVIRSIVQVPIAYTGVCLMLLALILLSFFIVAFTGRILTLPIFSTLVLQFISLYFLAVEMRVLGLMYRAYQNRLRWF